MIRKLVLLLVMLAPIAVYSQVGTFILTKDTVVTINNSSMAFMLDKNITKIVYPSAIVLTHKLAFRKGLPIQLFNGYPVQFDKAGKEVKPTVIGATTYNFITDRKTEGSLSNNDGAFGKPFNPKPKTN